MKVDNNLNDANEVLAVAFHLIKEKYEKLITTHTLTVTETHRPVERQQELYAQGRTTPGDIVTNIDGVVKKGLHNYFPSRAIDVAVVNKATGKITWDVGYYRPLVKLCEEASTDLKKTIVSGGSWKTFKDWPHIQLG